ncbi:uncharacterized protein [Montipora capricornis]|uniref:uncharacterized protein n=1 Tax=Montipora capricornis TaxID=246305 RepID=UPI0035F14C6F
MVTCTGHIGIHEEADGRTDGKCEKRTPELFETECSVQNSKLSDWSRSSACLSVKSSPSNSVSSQKSSMSKCGSQRQSPGRSTPDTETVIDVQEDFNFIMSDDIQKCNKDSTYPDENVLRRFMRDAAACLQGLVGSESISYSDFIVAATKICDTFPILWDPRLASFPPAKKIISFLGHCPLHVKEAHPESTLIPKEENKGEKTSNP